MTSLESDVCTWVKSDTGKNMQTKKKQQQKNKKQIWNGLLCQEKNTVIKNTIYEGILC